MAWSEIKKAVNSDLGKPLNELLEELLSDESTGLAALLAAIETNEAAIATNKGLLNNTTYGLSAIKTAAANANTYAKNVNDRLTATRAGYLDYLANSTYGLSALLTAVTTNKNLLNNTTYGLNALKTAIGNVNTNVQEADMSSRDAREVKQYYSTFTNASEALLLSVTGEGELFSAIASHYGLGSHIKIVVDGETILNLTDTQSGTYSSVLGFVSDYCGDYFMPAGHPGLKYSTGRYAGKIFDFSSENVSVDASGVNVTHVSPYTIKFKSSLQIYGNISSTVNSGDYSAIYVRYWLKG